MDFHSRLALHLKPYHYLFSRHMFLKLAWSEGVQFLTFGVTTGLMQRIVQHKHPLLARMLQYNQQQSTDIPCIWQYYPLSDILSDSK